MIQKRRNNRGIATIWLIWIVLIIAGIVWLIRQNAGPVSPIRRMVRDVNKYGFSDIYDQFNVKGFALFVILGEDNLDDYWELYKELKAEIEDNPELEKEFEQAQGLLDEYADELAILMDNGDSTYKVKIKKVMSTDKVSKNLYRVKVKIATETKVKDSSLDDSNDKTTTVPETLKFYVLKEGPFNYSIVGLLGWSVDYGEEFVNEYGDELFDFLDIDT